MRAMSDSVDHRLDEAIASACRQLGFDALKPQQYKAIRNFMEGKEVFVVLPIGFGKSVIFGILPLAYDLYLSRTAYSIVIVITPLAALMKEFKEKFAPKGISAEFLGELQDDTGATERVIEGKHQLVFCSPENLLENPSLRDMLTSSTYKDKLVAIVVDEAHCIDKWGVSFRSAYSRLGDIRCLVPSEVHIMALTATITRQSYAVIRSSLGMLSTYDVIESPHKPNIFYGIIPRMTIQQLVGRLSDGIRKREINFPKTIIFCRSGEDCGKIYKLLRVHLGDEFTIPSGVDVLPGKRVAEIFSGPTSKGLKDRILHHIKEKDSPLRILIATIAFGMGMDIVDIRQVIHFGVPGSAEDYVQQSGRGGRDGMPVKAMIIRNRLFPGTSQEMKMFVSSDSSECRRKLLFKNFCGVHSVGAVEPLCNCCDVCLKLCKCGHCSYDVVMDISF